MNGNIKDPIAAVTHPDPYRYYRSLAAGKPFYYDADLNLWVASGADAVTAVLTNSHCKVRLIAEPVPKALAGSAAGEIFGRLVRMNDGDTHKQTKSVVRNSLSSIPFHRINQQAESFAQKLSAMQQNEFIFTLPVYSVASVLGFGEEKLPIIKTCVGDLVASFSPLADEAKLSVGIAAAEKLLTMFDENECVARMEQNGVEAATAKANAIGFLTQTYEATAGLIGNTLVALAREAALRKQIVSEPATLSNFIDEVIRNDPPVQNTRRFVHADTEICGQRLKAGDAILVVIAAANHDAALNSAPEIFDIDRADRCDFTFGLGAHECPGRKIAHGIARAGVSELVGKLDFDGLTDGLTYCRSVNARIPIFQK